MTFAEALARAADTLAAAGLAAEESRIDAAVLARARTGWATAEWILRQREAAPPEFLELFRADIARRTNGEPVAYIAGVREFYGRVFRVSPAVLIPRPETELVIDEAKRALGPSGRLAKRRALDIGAGSGCLAITLALEESDLAVDATDVSEAALDVARSNGLELGANVTWQLAAFAGDRRDSYDLVVSNPPYIAAPDRPRLPPDVRDFEPELALFGGDDGLRVIEPLIGAASIALVPGGSLVMEIGRGQQHAVHDLISANEALEVVRISQDLAGIDRVIVARKLGISV